MIANFCRDVSIIVDVRAEEPEVKLQPFSMPAHEYSFDKTQALTYRFPDYGQSIELLDAVREKQWSRGDRPPRVQMMLKR